MKIIPCMSFCKVSETSFLKEVTNKILEQLRAGIKPWHCAWNLPHAPNMLPIDPYSLRPYSGINALILWSQMIRRNYKSNYWVSYTEAGTSASVLADELGVHCLDYNLVSRKRLQEGQMTDEIEISVESKLVFNADQIGRLFKSWMEKPLEWFDRYEKAEQLVQNTGVVIRHTQWSPICCDGNVLVVPPKNIFANAEDYYAMLFHKLAHWTVRENKVELNNIKPYMFGEDRSVFEDLVAELSSAFLCAELGLFGTYTRVSFLEAWIKLLEEYDNAVVYAAALASKVHRYIMPRTMSYRQILCMERIISILSGACYFVMVIVSRTISNTIYKFNIANNVSQSFGFL